MAFSDTVQTTTNLTAGMQTYYSKLFLKYEEIVERHGQFATKYDIPRASGKTIQMFGYRPFAVVDTADVEGVVSANIQTIDQRNVSATLKEWSAYAKISTLASMTHIDPEMKGVTRLSGEQAGKTIDWQYALELGRAGHYPIRVDEDTTNTRTFYSTSVGTTTVITSTTIAETTADTWNGAHIVCDAGPNYGYSGRVSDYTTNTITITPAASIATATTDHWRMVETVGIAATDIATTPDLNQVLTQLQNNIASPQSDGYYAGVASPYVLGDLRSDTVFILASQYSNSTALYKGEFGKWANIRFIMTTQPYRENKMVVGSSVAGTNRALGGVFVTEIIGQDSYGGIHLNGANQQVYVRSWEQLGQATPTFGTIG